MTGTGVSLSLLKLTCWRRSEYAAYAVVVGAEDDVLYEAHHGERLEDEAEHAQQVRLAGVRQDQGREARARIVCHLVNTYRYES